MTCNILYYNNIIVLATLITIHGYMLTLAYCYTHVNLAQFAFFRATNYPHIATF